MGTIDLFIIEAQHSTLQSPSRPYLSYGVFRRRGKPSFILWPAKESASLSGKLSAFEKDGHQYHLMCRYDEWFPGVMFAIFS